MIFRQRYSRHLPQDLPKELFRQLGNVKARRLLSLCRLSAQEVACDAEARLATGGMVQDCTLLRVLSCRRRIARSQEAKMPVSCMVLSCLHRMEVVDGGPTCPIYPLGQTRLGRFWLHCLTGGCQQPVKPHGNPRDSSEGLLTPHRHTKVI
jgi:hypothetical protein